jgi:hypothetical protein
MPPDIMQLKSILFSGANFDELINDFIQGPQKNFYENDELYALVLPFNNFKIEYQKHFLKLILSIDKLLGT